MTVSEDLALASIRSKSPEETLKDLSRLEIQVRERIGQAHHAADYRPIGIPHLDWLVDQILFVREALSQLKALSLSDEDAIWLLEMLSLPECIRRAPKRWQRARLKKEALVNGNLRWRDVLLCKRRSDSVKCYPRLWGLSRQLTPYPSEVHCPKGWPNPWGYPLNLYLQRLFWPNPGGSLTPFQSSHTVSFYLSLHTPVGTLILDCPRNYSRDECLAQLGQWKELLHSQLEQIREGSSHLALKDRNERQWIWLMGWGRTFTYSEDLESLEKHWQSLKSQLDQDIERLKRGPVTPSRRAAILQRYFTLPGETWLVPLHIVPIDLTSDLLAMLLGAWLKAREWLSVRESRKLTRLVEWQLLALANDLPSDRAQPLAREVLARFGAFARPLKRASIRAYLKRVVKRGLTSARVGAIQRAPKGQVSKLASQLNIHPKTITRRYQRYRTRRGLPPGPEAWKKFRLSLKAP